MFSVFEVEAIGSRTRRCVSVVVDGKKAFSGIAEISVGKIPQATKLLLMFRGVALCLYAAAKMPGQVW